MKYITHSEEETIALGKTIAQYLKPGAVLALMGHLGSGKTRLTRGICEGLQVQQPVTSPTFVLINEYRGKYPVYHFDFYRLESEAEIWDLGIDEYINGDGICIIEWAEHGLNLLPDSRIEIRLKSAFDSATDTIRQIDIRDEWLNAKLAESPELSEQDV